MSTALKEHALEVALTQLGVKETAPNAGPDIEGYLHTVGLFSGQPWCAAFCVWVYLRAARELGLMMPLPRTGKVIRLWRRAPRHFRTNRPTVGAIFCHATKLDNPETSGHCGIVESVNGNHITSIEGNTNDAGERDGDGVQRKMRRLDYVNLGYLDVGMLGPEEPTPRNP